MSGLPTHDQAPGRAPRPSTTAPSTSAGAAPGHEMPVWMTPEQHQLLQPQYSGRSNSSQPQRFGRPTAYAPPAHPTPLDFLAMSGHQPPFPPPNFPYPDSYRPSMFLPPNYPQAPHNDGFYPFGLPHPQYALPHFAPSPFMTPEHDLSRPPASRDGYDRGNSAGSQNAQNWNLRERARSNSQRSNTGTPDDRRHNVSDEARSRFSSHRYSNLTRHSRPSLPPATSEEPNSRADSRELAMQRRREMTRLRRDSEDLDATSPRQRHVSMGGVPTPQSQRQDQLSGLELFSSDSSEDSLDFDGILRRGISSRREELERMRRDIGRLDAMRDRDIGGLDALRERRGILAARQRAAADPPTISEAQISSFKSGLKRMVLSDLPEGADTECEICVKEYSQKSVTACEDEEVAVELPCKHVFGEDCLNNWCNTCKIEKRSITCPKCRKVLVEPPPRFASRGRLPIRYGANPPPSTAADWIRHLDNEENNHLRIALPPRTIERLRTNLTALGDAPVGVVRLEGMLVEAVGEAMAQGRR
ncbi:uncharacterized protein BDZ99DRAFT_308021 [Mytilinidion resinicola]|uniref:RING-type domain-containing protein n=1 Tax=Mytilinidion resinicola TaxID=574789 RepID=A0A6A6YNT5_9PEZI|nr:uncharacterized protein BDZ99DRAFT_308021 [Mytilinidion resinicola]KAF2810243.1 hypothetical protein BDZ99DRAFT_308021 [Mytilinidion resinicola]